MQPHLERRLDKLVANRQLHCSALSARNNTRFDHLPGLERQRLRLHQLLG
ncbi:MAG: hypothetical protein GTO62_01055 [Planctomycetales bacterium]|nr:hypothetical protein [Planctomycetales bacterium]NIP68649.1 hypothetical protein [Planctomycetales bacterium]